MHYSCLQNGTLYAFGCCVGRLPSSLSQRKWLNWIALNESRCMPITIRRSTFYMRPMSYVHRSSYIPIPSNHSFLFRFAGECGRYAHFIDCIVCRRDVQYGTAPSSNSSYIGIATSEIQNWRKARNSGNSNYKRKIKKSRLTTRARLL